MNPGSPNGPEIIDVDSLSDHEHEPVFLGFHRDVAQSKQHLQSLATDGFAFTGFKVEREPTKRTRSSVQPRNTRLSVPRESAIIISSDSEDGKPVAKKPKASTSNSSNSRRTSTGATERLPSRRSRGGMSTPVNHYGPEREEEDYATVLAALDLDCGHNWRDMKYSQKLNVGANGDMFQDQDDLAASSAARRTSGRVYHRIEGLQSQSLLFDWSVKTPSSRMQHGFSIYRKAARARSTQPSLLSTWSSKDLKRHPSHFIHNYPLRRAETIHKAPGDINTVAQLNHLVVIASVVSDGRSDDTPGEYNKEGSLSVWSQTHAQGHVLQEHSAEGPMLLGRSQRHHFTVNDVAIDPSSPTRFVSAGRDRKVLTWNYDPSQEGSVPELVAEATCEDNPEIVKYRPGGSLVAVQCDNGTVYLLQNGHLDHCFPVASHIVGHFTADMAWGLGPTQNLIFASSSCSADGSGLHKAYDFIKHTVLMEFDAEKQACSALALDPFGEALYIVTEGSNSSYILRQYDARHRRHRSYQADQHVTLEPFPIGLDRASTDVNSLSVSSDGVYLAAGRTDNWIDVYDARMLQRGPLHSFSHEGGGGLDTYGVVKTQWVDGHPYGFGLVSGGVDGCIRLWDVKLASHDPMNGKILAKGDYDIATFCLGDQHKGEVPIIIGECSGKVTSFK